MSVGKAVGAQGRRVGRWRLHDFAESIPIPKVHIGGGVMVAETLKTVRASNGRLMHQQRLHCCAILVTGDAAGYILFLRRTC